MTADDTPTPTPPQLPQTRDTATPTSGGEPRNRERPTSAVTRAKRADIAFAESFKPMPSRPGTWSVLDALLKTPARIVHELIHGDRPRVTLILLVTAVLSYLVYGACMGSFSGGHALWKAPLKMAVGMLASALICLPSLYILTCMGGGKQTLRDAAGLLALLLALSGVLLVGFAPIAWVFSVSTGTVAFMGGLHLAIWSIATIAGLGILARAFRCLNEREIGTLRVWSIIFVVVALQMSTVLRPVIARPDPAYDRGKMFFLEHWGKCLTFEEGDML